MKELEQPITDKVVIVSQTEVAKQNVKLGTVRLQPGMTWWELDLRTMKIRKAVLVNPRAEVVPVKNIFTGRVVGSSFKKVADLTPLPNCWYDVAINWQNAKRKFLNRIKNETENSRHR